MDPKVTAWLTQSQYSRKGDDLQREYVVYRPPANHLWPRLSRATRCHLSALFLTLGERLSNEAPIATPVEIDPTIRTP